MENSIEAFREEQKVNCVWQSGGRERERESVAWGFEETLACVFLVIRFAEEKERAVQAAHHGSDAYGHEVKSAEVKSEVDEGNIANSENGEERKKMSMYVCVWV